MKIPTPTPIPRTLTPEVRALVGEVLPSLEQEFAEVIAPLERAAGRRLAGKHRRICLEAFRRYPEGVREVSAGALADATKNPIGLFFWRIQQGWHELEPLGDVVSGESSAARFRRLRTQAVAGNANIDPAAERERERDRRLPAAIADETCMQCAAQGTCYYDHRKLKKIVCRDCFQAARTTRDGANS